MCVRNLRLAKHWNKWTGRCDMGQAHPTGLPLYRVYLLRLLYALIGLVQGSQTWPAILHHTKPWAMWHGVSMALLGAFTALCLLGIRYPVKMLPLMMFELAWKLLWVLAAWLPLSVAHRVDTDTAAQLFPIV